MTQDKNPLLEQFDEAPFSRIKDKHFKPAIEALVKETKAEIDAITSNKDEPTFKNTIEALEFSGMQLDRVTSIFFNLNSAETSENLQKIAQEISPLLSEFGNDITLNKALFERVKAVYNNKSKFNLSEEQEMLLNKKHKSFTRNGANLNAEDQKKLREIDNELSKLKLKFGENVLAETNNFQLHITDLEKLKGLPESILNDAKELAKSQNKPGYIFTLHYPSYVPFMKYASNRELRKEMALAYGSRCYKNNEYNNEENVLKIVSLRYKRAKLLGYKTHSDYVLEERMAKDPDTVYSFLNDLLEKAKPVAIKQFKELEDFAKKLDDIDQLQKWDGAYYTEKLKKQSFSLDDEELKPYFKLENVISGVFKISEKLFNLTFEEVFNIEKYHEDVKTFKVYEEGKFKALFYADFHPRSGKRPGAWMTSFKSQYIKDGINHRPHISNVCNFSKPSKDKPSLLTFNEVTTLFHEFGHALHGILADTIYPSLSGTSVSWDFVELPSQLLENWCYEKEALELFAFHYKTGEIIPTRFINKIKELNKFQEGVQTLRQISFGILDMDWHNFNPNKIKLISQQEFNSFKTTKLYPVTTDNLMSTSFAHIFQGGYSSGYYSYKWAEVLDADTFDYFKTKGIFNPDLSFSFKENILSKGGTVSPEILYKKFRGKNPSNTGLIERAGLN
ncbi:M3 family metallopeptidase [Croceibacter atlanticus]|uniref:M3 family metallopeptidase n=1 Tax=Croceibacter atlanticus TaxID=313588 RepID=UPI0030F790AE